MPLRPFITKNNSEKPCQQIQTIYKEHWFHVDHVKEKNFISMSQNVISISRLFSVCDRVVKMVSNSCDFQNLSHLKLSNFYMLEKLPDLHKLERLRKLDIFNCPKLKNFPKEFGEYGAFSLLDIFSLGELDAFT